MDLKLKSKSWAGNIYHQFESICQDVDDFMGKDTVRFVENQVQSVKRLYSNVVQDILPPSADIAKPESQSTDGEQASTVDEKRLSENQGSVDNFRNSDASLPIEVDIGVDENITRVSIPLAVNSISDDVIISGTSDEDHENSTSIMDEEGLITVETERRDFLIFESNDNVFQMDGSDFGGGLSEQRYKDGQSEIEIPPPSETGNRDEFVVGIGELNMEMVDLFPDVKHDETSVILNHSFVHAASHRSRNFRYYKKLIQDALTSRNRLSKEYEHLAILYGDIDSESSQHFGQISVPSSPNTFVHAVRTESFHEMSETEWELV